MQQQINLYQPAKTAQHHELLNASTAISALGMVAIVLMLIYGYGVYAVNKLAHNVELARLQQQKQTTLFSNNTNASNNTNTTHELELSALQANLRTITATLDQHRRALQLLRVGALGGDSGFSARLIALAQQHVDGVWLDQIVLSSNGGVDRISGATINAELIPRYLHNLGLEPALRGTRFDEFTIDGKDAVIQPGSDETSSSETSRAHIQFHAANAGSNALTDTPTDANQQTAPAMAGSS